MTNEQRRGAGGTGRRAIFGRYGGGEEVQGGASHLAGFVLGDFVLGVFSAVFAAAVGAAGFGDVDLDCEPGISASIQLCTLDVRFFQGETA